MKCARLIEMVKAMKGYVSYYVTYEYSSGKPVLNIYIHEDEAKEVQDFITTVAEAANYIGKNQYSNVYVFDNYRVEIL